MAKITLNIAKTYSNGFIADLEKSKYFQLHKNEATRADLYCFAIACAIVEGKEPTPIQNVGPVTSFVRTEFLTNYEPLFSCLFFEEYLKDKPDKIDEICNRDNVYDLMEKYANTGFGIIKKWTEEIEEETLFYKLVGYMDKVYDEVKEEVNQLI